MSRKLLSIAAALSATAIAGCGAEDPTSGSPDPSPSASSSSPAEAAGPCLFEPAQVATVIPGTWEHTPDDDVCTYSSDRGAIFVTTLVDTAAVAGLEASRKDCITNPEPVEIGERAFVCVEKHDDGDLIVGNVAIGGRLWSLVIVPNGGVHDAELGAMGKLVDMVAD